VKFVGWGTTEDGTDYWVRKSLFFFLEEEDFRASPALLRSLGAYRIVT